MVKKLRGTPKPIIGAFLVLTPLLFFTFNSFGVDSDALLEGWEITRATIDKDTNINIVEKQVATIQKQQAAGTTVAQNAGGKLTWPVPSSRLITSKFGPRNTGIAGASKNHGGIDIRAATGTPVVAAADGTVVISKYSSTAGNYIQIDHSKNMSTQYMHNSQLLVKKGDKVKRGQVIAKSGSTGIGSGPHVHFGVIYKGNKVNPVKYVDMTGVTYK